MNDQTSLASARPLTTGRSQLTVAIAAPAAPPLTGESLRRVAELLELDVAEQEAIRTASIGAGPALARGPLTNPASEAILSAARRAWVDAWNAADAEHERAIKAADKNHSLAREAAQRQWRVQYQRARKVSGG